MQYERDTEWPEKLQPAVFAANTQFKRSISFTPFRLMFGRDCDPFGLLKLVTGSLEDDIFEDDISDDGKSVIVNTFAVVFISRCVSLWNYYYRLITNHHWKILTNFPNLLTMNGFNKLRITELLIGFLLDRTSNVSRRFRRRLMIEK